MKTPRHPFRTRGRSFHPAEHSEDVHPTECNEGVAVYPAEHSEDVYPTECNEGVVAVAD